MKRVFIGSFVLGVLLAASLNALAQNNAAVVGTWDMTLETPQGTRNFPFSLKEDGGKLVASTPFKSAEVKGDSITMKMTVKFNDNDLEITYTGKIKGDSMSGDADFGGFASGTWSAKRKDASASPPPASSPAQSGAVNVTGNWNATVETQAGSGNPSFTLKQEGENLTGTYKGQFGEAPLKGTVKGNDISFAFKVDAQGQSLDITYTGKVNGDSMSGKVVLGSFGEGTWTAKRAK